MLGVAGFVLMLFTAGAFMESNVPKTIRFAGATLAVCLLILFVGDNRPISVKYGDCWIDWDGRSNPEVCE